MMTLSKKRFFAGIGMVIFLLACTVCVGIAAMAYIAGKIEQDGTSYVLIAPNSNYTLEGSDTISEMAGKYVVVSGEVTERDDMKILKVSSCEEIEE